MPAIMMSTWLGSRPSGGIGTLLCGISTTPWTAASSSSCVERAVDLDVGVQVGDWRPGLAHQMSQQPGLDRRRQLEHGVAHRHVHERLAPDLGRSEHLEGLRAPGRCGPSKSSMISVQKRPSGWCSGERARQHACVREVVLGDDRADVQGAQGSSGARAALARLRSERPVLRRRRATLARALRFALRRRRESAEPAARSRAAARDADARRPDRPGLFDNPDGKLVFPGLDPKQYRSVLDFGCGCGRVARQLIQQRPRPAALRRARPPLRA